MQNIKLRQLKNLFYGVFARSERRGNLAVASKRRDCFTLRVRKDGLYERFFNELKLAISIANYLQRCIT
jgi:hypothetical protein